jgi:hypothetical protein
MVESVQIKGRGFSKVSEDLLQDSLRLMVRVEHLRGSDFCRIERGQLAEDILSSQSGLKPKERKRCAN